MSKEIKEYSKGLKKFKATIYLRNGEKFEGYILDVTTYEILFKTRDGKTLLIFKHAIENIDYSLL